MSEHVQDNKDLNKPMDKDWIVESLSDKNLNTAYYTISRFVTITVKPENLQKSF